MPVPATRRMMPAGVTSRIDVVAAVGDEDVALGVHGGAAGVVQRRGGGLAAVAVLAESR